MKNVLIVATSSWAGMGPYASEIINLFDKEDNVYYFCVEDERHFFSKNISQTIRAKGMILYRANSNLNKLCDLLFPPKKIVRRLLSICKEKDISKIHFLTSECPYSKTIISLCKNYDVFFTVHDLYPHEAQKAFHEMIRQRRMYQLLENTRKAVENLITNSKSQEAELRKMYPDKNIFYHEFPSLMNASIVSGHDMPSEIKGRNKYVLYFGRIEKYKGIDLAYNAFIEREELKGYTLVIAGSGTIYFKRDVKKENNIVFINRYIKDEEVACLFEHAIITLYPYISATQSGVLSLSCYFGKPIIASDVPYFRIVGEKGLGLNFKRNDIDSLAETILSAFRGGLLNFAETANRYYKTHFSKESLKGQLLEIYNR